MITCHIENVFAWFIKKVDSKLWGGVPVKNYHTSDYIIQKKFLATIIDANQ